MKFVMVHRLVVSRLYAAALIAVSSGVILGAPAAEAQLRYNIQLGSATPKAYQCYRGASRNVPDIDAIKTCTESLERESLLRQDRARTLANRGVLYFANREYAEAAEDFTAAIEIGLPEDYLLYFNRGLAYERQGLYDEAGADFRLALEERPGWDRAEEKLALRRYRLREPSESG